MRIKKIDLFADLFEKEFGIPDIYTGMEYDNINKFPVSPIGKKDLRPIYSLKFVPDYLSFPLSDASLYRIKKLYQVKGYSIRIDDVADINSYVKCQFKSNAKTIQRYVNRLESCFSIKYKMFYGQIDIDDYNFIMDSLYHMMKKRFDQLQVNNESEPKWEHIRKITYDLILKKRASLFVIYDGPRPIEISINFHFNGILFSSISSFDIDYSKFGLGHVEIYKQIEWCLKNGHKIFEMGRGDLDYKRRWSNRIYIFEHHIIYHRDSFLGELWSIKEVWITRLKTYLKSKNIDVLYKKFKSLLTPRVDAVDKSKEYTIETLNSVPTIKNMTHVDINLESNAFLRKYIYDFLYSTIEHISNIQIYHSEHQDLYVVKGIKKAIKIYRTN